MTKLLVTKLLVTNGRWVNLAVASELDTLACALERGDLRVYSSLSPDASAFCPTPATPATPATTAAAGGWSVGDRMSVHEDRHPCSKHKIIMYTQTQTQAQTQTQTQTHRHRHRHRHTDTQTHRHTETDKEEHAC